MFQRNFRIEWLKSHARHERKLGRIVRDFLRDQAGRMADRLQDFDAPGPSVVPQIFRADDEHLAFMQAVVPALAKIMGEGAGQLAQQAKSARQMLFPFAEEDILQILGFELGEEVARAIWRELNRMAEQPYWGAIQAETERRLTAIIGDGLLEGQSTYKIGMNIREHLGGMPANKRAQRIARTETSAALNAGHQQQADAMAAEGLAVSKTWTTVGDGDVRECHAALEGVGTDVRGMFDVEGVLVPYPAHWSLPAKQRIGCRCSFYTDAIDLHEPEPDYSEDEYQYAGPQPLL